MVTDMSYGQWNYEVTLDKTGKVSEVLKCRSETGGYYIYTQIERNHDGTFNSYQGDPMCGGSNKDDVPLDEAFAILDDEFTRRFKTLFLITGVRLHPRQVRSIVRDKTIRMEIYDIAW